mmetsp:Transcript_39431/g.79705  ORF Transcript_39431/g.79705 Transcript_39431/m.79705 type:complete len:98 (-) Transcript_39431:115-408(-)
MRRVDNFTLIAFLAAVCNLALAGTKYWLAVKSETDAAKDALANTAQAKEDWLRLSLKRGQAQYQTSPDAVGSQPHLLLRLVPSHSSLKQVEADALRG